MTHRITRFEEAAQNVSHVRKLAESEEISDTNMKMWEEIFKAESEEQNE